MRPSSKVFVAGHLGLAGSAILRRLKALGYGNVVLRTRAELELRDAEAVSRFFSAEKPDVVFLAAATAGGIMANQTYPVEFIRDNLEIQNNVINAAWRTGVEELLFLGSSCIYPRDCPQPIKEGYLLSGPLEATNRPYAIAKIAGIELCWAYNRQYGTRYLCAMPTNLYGPGDNYDLQTGHVVPALIRKFHQAKISGGDSVTVWGTGKPRREFLHSDDMAAACVHLVEHADRVFGVLSSDRPPLVNAGCGEDLTISRLAQLIRDVVGGTPKIIYDHAKPDGTPQKLLDVSLMRSLGWSPAIALRDGLETTYKAFLALPGVAGGL